MSTPWQQLRAKLKDLKADPESLLVYLLDLRDQAMDGIITEKVSPRGEVIDVAEKHPKIALDCTLAMLKIADDIYKRSEATDDNGVLEIRIVTASPNETPDKPGS